ncbi:hypothetical protein EXIGLDRAFT_720871 [Exidia glandulosa HHB12029]|uniref:Uncharacterized protein n=1 Tax=Exidia glandulosa HHB12029 TaxID=1314781 RepID=A0A165NEM3_EXIGL|nr:hypothetical protein EXIGLDRAFT_720871 [Exidia glandulosa HHB12029]
MEAGTYVTVCGLRLCKRGHQLQTLLETTSKAKRPPPYGQSYLLGAVWKYETWRGRERERAGEMRVRALIRW